MIDPKDALRYSKPACEAEIDRRRKNIKLFEDQIANENEEIRRLSEIIAVIDAHQ